MNNASLRPRNLSPFEASKRIGGGMTAARVRLLARSGEIQSARLGRSILILRDPLERQLRGSTSGGGDLASWTQPATLSVAEATAQLQISPARIRSLIRSQRIEAVRLGRIWYVLKEPFERIYSALLERQVNPQGL